MASRGRCNVRRAVIRWLRALAFVLMSYVLVSSTALAQERFTLALTRDPHGNFLDVPEGQSGMVACPTLASLLFHAEHYGDAWADLHWSRVTVHSQAAFEQLHHIDTVRELRHSLRRRLEFNCPLPATTAGQAWVAALNVLLAQLAQEEPEEDDEEEDNEDDKDGDGDDGDDPSWKGNGPPRRDDDKHGKGPPSGGGAGDGGAGGCGGSGGPSDGDEHTDRIEFEPKRIKVGAASLSAHVRLKGVSQPALRLALSSHARPAAPRPRPSISSLARALKSLPDSGAATATSLSRAC
jgi:hypothetical protein